MGFRLSFMKIKKEKSMRKSKLLGFFLVLVQFNLVQAQVSLNYDLFLDKVIKNNPIAEKALNIKGMAELKNLSAKGNYDPIISGGLDKKYYNSTNYYTHVNAEFKQALYTSQYLKLGYDYGGGYFLSPEQYTGANGLPYLGLEFSVLQGLMFDKRRAELIKSRKSINYYDAEKNSILNDLLYESSQAYFECLFVNKQINLYDYFISLAKQRMQGIVALSESGEKPAIDTIEAGILLQSRFLDYQSMQIEFQNKQNMLNTFYWNDDKSNTSMDFIQSDSLEWCYLSAKQNLQQIIEKDSAINPELLKYSAMQDMLEVDVRLKREMIKPKFDINYNFLSNNNNFAPSWGINNYKWGANLSFPLFFRNANNDYKVSQLQLKNNKLDLKNKTNALRFKKKIYNQNILLIQSQIKNAEQSVSLSKKMLELEKIKFDNGESSLFMLNQRENKWLEQELKLNEYKFKFVKTVLSLIYLKGDLNYRM